MDKKIKIQKDILEDLYNNKQLSTRKIADKFNCDHGVIIRRLNEYKIRIRNPKKKINIPKEKLHDLYIKKKLSVSNTAKRLGISHCSTYYKLKKAGIKLRKKNLLKVNKEKLHNLYINKKLPVLEIAKKLNSNRTTIFENLKKFNIPTKSLSEANTLYPKKKFEGNRELKAYMIGFRIGDLKVKAINKDSTIFISSNTTKEEQFNLIKKIYGKYGHFKSKKYGNIDHIYCNLDKSFNFLIKKEDNIERWILKDNKLFLAFLGGFIDAEGSFGVYQNRARFRVGSYEKNIIFQIKERLNSMGILTKFTLESKANKKRKQNQDFYRATINEKNSLLKFIQLTKSHIKHKKRYKDSIKCEKNILERNKKEEIKFKGMDNKNKFYITTTIPYANAAPHIGFALEIVNADVLARWNQLKGKKVFFLTGTDEHGSKNYKTAKNQGLDPQEFVDKNSKLFRQLTKELNISNNYFIRTTDKKIHWPGVIELWKILNKKGDIHKKKYVGNYCSGCERFVTSKDLVNGHCQNHPNIKIEKISEENYFFELSKYSNKIVDLIKKDKLKISPRKWKNDFLSLIKEGLIDVSFSRDKKYLPWGVPVPGDNNQVMYVWCDALPNYLTGIGYPNKKFKDFWPADIHVVGKDMLRFHAGIWPGMLLSAGLPLPKEIIVHGFLTVDGKKMSKSLGNVISPLELRKKYESDSIRYVLLRETPFGDDGDFSEKLLIERHNNELANKLGNLITRTTALAEKNSIQKTNNNLLKKLNIKKINNHFNNYEFDKALNEIFKFIDICNEYIQSNKIWQTKDKKKLYELIDSIKAITILLYPFIPETSEKIAKNLKFEIKYDNINKPIKVSKIKKSEILFKKIK